jgi:hypothetical protein
MVIVGKMELEGQAGPEETLNDHRRLPHRQAPQRLSAFSLRFLGIRQGYCILSPSSA